MTTAVQDNPAFITRSPRSGPSPLAAAVRFLVRHAGELAPLSLGPVLLSAAIAYVAFRYPLAQHEWFLVFVTVFVVEAWLLNCAFMFTYEKLCPAARPGGSIAVRALHLLPKVLLSLTVVICMFAAASAYPYLLLFSLVFIWAPFFVAGETYGKEIVKDPDDDEPYEGGEDGFGVPKDEYTFSSQRLWQIGLGRSFVFSVTNLSLTLELVILLFLVRLAPVALVAVLKGSSSHPVFPVIDGAVPTFLLLYFLSGVTYLFLLYLPRAAREEISLPRFTEEEQLLRRTQKPHPFVIVVGVPLTLLAYYWGVMRELQITSTVPASAQMAIETVRRQGDTLIWRVRLEDGERQFRWLDPDDFRLTVSRKSEVSLPPAAEQAESKAADSAPVSAGDTREERRTHTAPEFQPDRAYVFDADGNLLEHAFRPSYRPLAVDVRFSIPAVVLDDMKSAELSYRVDSVLSRPIGEIRLSDVKDHENPR